jgi:hypothetical protein
VRRRGNLVTLGDEKQYRDGNRRYFLRCRSDYQSEGDERIMPRAIARIEVNGVSRITAAHGRSSAS